MDKTYNPADIETRWYQQWESRGYFSPVEADEAYCIMIPPPNVTGSLHMGHAFQDTIMDTLIRFNRMRGKSTLWQPGTDHAGIATQMVVERQLAGEGIKRHDLGRDKFIDKIWDWKAESGGNITRQLRRMGASVDWSRERFTMDDGLSEAVQKVFISLYEEDLIYRGERLVNWDPVLNTAISDLEVESEEEDGHMWHFKYPLSDGSGHMVVATTRPETMLGDTAVAVNPKDERYEHLVGKTIDLPLTDRKIPIIADRYVDAEFGTGCVKITPAHDFNDYMVGDRNDLEMITILNKDATINENAPEKYQGMDRFDARKAVVADLDAAGLLEKIEPHKLKVPRGDRSKSVIEPLLTDQWFVRAAPLAEPAVEAVKTGKIKFVPENWDKTYYNWMTDIEDWCISRQIWWGHRIPAWYDDNDKIYVGADEADVRAKHNLGSDVNLRQDEDVLDTWFSSALWPFSTLGWPQDEAELKQFYPTNVLVTGFDIIFFWVARMIMMGIKFTGEVPFKEVYVHGLVRDEFGQKMSKSKGNVLDPIDVIDGIDLESLVKKRTTGLMNPENAPKIEANTRKAFPDGIESYGTDAMRFTFAALATTGRDIRFDLNRVEGYRNFCNKLWNAARYVMMQTEGEDTGVNDEPVELTAPDRWIISRLQQVEKSTTEHLDAYRLDLASKELYEFLWNEYCDWYLELSKPVLWDDNASVELKRGTRRTLVRVLETTLRLLHPIMPYITEEIWQKIGGLAGKSGETIMTQPFPVANDSKIDSAAETEVQWIMDFILGVRQIRGEMDIAPSKAIPVVLQNASDDDHRRMQEHNMYLAKLAKLDTVEFLADGDKEPEASIALLGQMKILVPMAGLIDKDAELERINKQLTKTEGVVTGLQKKLSNDKFVNGAPEAVVAKERDKLAEAEATLVQLNEQKVKIEAL